MVKHIVANSGQARPSVRNHDRSAARGKTKDSSKKNTKEIYFFLRSLLKREFCVWEFWDVIKFQTGSKIFKN